MIPDPRLDEIVLAADTYLAHARRLTYAELRAQQAPPFASLAFGAAGLAYFFWRAARVREDSSLLEDAARWVDAVERADPEDYAVPSIPRTRPDSLYYGPDGALWTHILVSAARGEEYERAAAAFAARSRRRRASAELLLGTAGYLAGAQRLFEGTSDARFLAMANGLAARLVADAADWTTMTPYAFAHGRAGVLYALLRWAALEKKGQTSHARALRTRVTDLVRAMLEPLAADETLARRAARTAPPKNRHRLTRSWCNGAAGTALLWQVAYAWEPDPRYLTRARACARHLRTTVGDGGSDLCCGQAGRAYALLAAHELEPQRGWLDLAVSAAAHARTREGPWPNALLKGYPGLAMLAWDLATPGEREGFPLFG